MEKKKKILVTLFALVLLLSVIAVTYAYFATTTDNSNAQSASVQAGTMQLTFADNDAGVSGNLGIGESITKKFTISNTGSLDAYAKMNWYNLVNTYTNRSLTYTLEYSESQNGAYKALVNNANVPVSSSASTQLLASPIKVPVGKTYYYNLTITLNNLEFVDQTADFSATMSSNFTVESIKPNVAEETLATLGLTANTGTPDFTNISPGFEGYTDTQFSGSQSSRSMSSYASRYYTYADSYTFNTSTGTYTLVNPQVGQYSSIYSSLSGKYIVSNSGSDSSSTASYTNLSTIYQVQSSTTSDTLYYKTSTKTAHFTDESETGIWSMEDDYGTSYYFRGNVTNNYVNFAGFYWRIIRINGDGSIRMIYDGRQAYANGTSDSERLALTGIVWNTTNYNDAKYVGYMYGGANGEASTSYEQATTNETETNIKTKLDGWYKTNIDDKGYTQYLSDEIFCNDRSLSGGDGIGTTTTYYGAYNRLYTNKTPQLTCPQKNDAFTVSDTTNGNGALKYPVGLITADEISLAGGRQYYADGSSNNSSYYLYKGNWYWSLSPFDFNGNYARVFYVNITGYLGNSYVSDVNRADGVAPVINLSAEYSQQLRGSGTASDPFTLATGQ